MRAVLVFCEGRHDVVFVQRSLAVHGRCEWVGGPLGELPSPFGRNSTGRGILAMRLAQHVPDDLTLQAAAYPPLPCFESIVQSSTTDTMFLMARVGGQDQSAPVLDLLEDLDGVFGGHEGNFDVTEYAAAFLFDADSDGVAAKLDGFRGRYRAHFGDLSGLGHGKWIATRTTPVGCFVFHEGGHAPTGTLEDHLAPMAARAWPERYAEAECFVERNRVDDDEVSKSEAERLKATITITGQFDHPGDPMSIIIGRTGLPDAQFQESPVSAGLAAFLLQAPWQHT